MENSVKWGNEIRKGSGLSALAGQGGSGWGSKQDHRPEVEVARETLPGHGRGQVAQRRGGYAWERVERAGEESWGARSQVPPEDRGSESTHAD